MAGPIAPLSAARLLGGHVARRTQRSAAERQCPAAFEPPRQTKVRHLGRAVLGEQDVAGLEIAMHDPALMRRVHGVGQRR